MTSTYTTLSVDICTKALLKRPLADSRVKLSCSGPQVIAARLYADVQTKLTNALLAVQYRPIFSSSIILNVNLPEVGPGCSKVDDFKFVLASAETDPTPVGTKICGSTSLPVDQVVVTKHQGCFASVVVTSATTAEPFPAGTAEVFSKT